MNEWAEAHLDSTGLRLWEKRLPGPPVLSRVVGVLSSLSR